ncbi:MAG: HEAT repeat domain-containing protein [Desulfobacterales bacterium]|jgi:hypothetical protein
MSTTQSEVKRMAFETRDQALERVMKLQKPLCPHCETEMSLWEVPPINFGDGLGWGEPFLFVCFNDECPAYVNGWEHMQETYAHRASYRCMNYPGTEVFEFMPVFSPHGGTGQVLDDQVLAQQEALKAATKKGFNILASCYVEKDGPAILGMLMDPAEPPRVRMKAAEMLGDIGDIGVIEPLRSLKLGNDLIQKTVDDSVSKIHTRFFTRECPFCAEVIKQRAKICKHCGKEVAGE